MVNNLNANNKIRIVWLDFVKLFTIYLVVLGHVIQFLQSSNPKGNELWLFIYSFHMPLFMLVAGYFSKKVVSGDIIKLLKTKSIQLLLPCVIWGILVYLFKHLSPIISFPNSAISFIKGVVFEIGDVLWFLKCLFICMLLFRIFKKNAFLLFVSIIISQILPYKVPLMYPCFLIGLYCEHINFFNKISIKSAISFAVLFLISFYFFEARHMDTNLRVSALNMMKGDFIPFISEFLARGYRLFIGVVGSLAVISLIKILYLNFSHLEPYGKFAKYGAQTQAVYILHGPILVYAIANYMNLDFMSHYTFSYLISPSIAMILTVFCYLIINKIPFSARKLLFGSSN